MVVTVVPRDGRGGDAALLPKVKIPEGGFKIVNGAFVWYKSGDWEGGC